MANITVEEKEKRLDQIEQLILSGFGSLRDIMRTLGINDMDTAKDAVNIARRRLRNKYYNTRHYKNIFFKELASLENLERRVFGDYLQASKDKDHKAMAAYQRNILEIKKRRADMMGIDAAKPAFNLNLNLSDKKEIQDDGTTKQIDDLIVVFRRITTEIRPIDVEVEGGTDTGSPAKPVALRSDIPSALPDGNNT